MQLVTFDRSGEPRFGAVVGPDVIDLAVASERFGATGASALPSRFETFLDRLEPLQPLLDRIVAQASSLQGRDVRTSLADVVLLPPLLRPGKIVCVARNYAEHAKEAGLPLSPIPILFARFADTLVADGAPVVVPAVSDSLDWEGELAVVIGKHTNGRRIGKSEAMDYVFGYSIFNDVTVRDYQFRVTQYTAGKNFRSSGPFGPVVVTADAIDPHNVDIRTTLNGDIVQFASTATMIFDIPTILEHIADFIDLAPGDVVAMGTPAGVGFKRTPPIFLKDGDTIRVEIAGIGTLTNPVVAERTR